MATNKQPMTGKQKAGLAGGIGGAIALIITAVLTVEGGYVNHPNDPGGETNHGITKDVARAGGYTGPMRDLTKEQAIDIYADKYVARPGFTGIVERSFHVGEETVDTGINAGPPRAARWFQESLNHFNERGRIYPDIAEDGRIGPASLAAYDALKRRRGAKLACELVLKAMDAKQAAHYMALGGKDRTFEAFMVGWFRTRIGNVDFRECR